MKTKLIKYGLFLLLILLVIPQNVLAVDLPVKVTAGRTVRVGIYETKPLAYSDKDGTAHGFFVDMLNRVAEKEQWDMQYVPGTWQEGLDRLKSDKIDMVLCIAYTEERDKYMDFPKEFLLLDWGVIFKSKGSKITSLLDLEGKSVTALKGDVYLTGFKELARQFNVNVKIQEVNQYPEVFKAVESGAVAAGVNGNLNGMLNEAGWRLEQTPIIFTPVKLGYAVNEGKNGDLITALDHNIAEMKADEVSFYNRELEQLMGKKNHKIPKEAYWALSGVAVALLFAILFILLLRRQVKAKTEHLEAEIARRTAAEESLQTANNKLQEQYEELQMNEEELRTQYDDLSATEEMLRVQIEEFENSQKLLKESEERYSLTIAAVNDGLWDWHVPSGEAVFSKIYYAMLGYEDGEFAANYNSWRTLVHPDDIERVEQQLREDIESGIGINVDLRMKMKSGGWLWVCTRGNTVETDEDGKVLRMVGTLSNVTKRKKVEEAREILESQLQQAQKIESIGRLAGGVAHDFNNMLTIILGHAQLGLMNLEPTNPVCANLQEISKTAERSADLTRQLLAFARKQTVEPKVIDLNDTVTGMLKMLQRLIGEDINFTWQPAADIWPVRMDPTQIDQILANLCVNARDAIEETGRLTIETENETIDSEYCKANLEAVPGEYVRLSVSDSGSGMDKETLTHIFEPFYTTKELGKGTGLGLATVYGAVKQNNGFINIYSEPGQGTTFSIYIPRNMESKSSQAVTVITPTPLLQGNETILLVEDEDGILQLATLLLEKQGYIVLKSASPDEAILMAREYKGNIQLLITDVIMPEMNGRDLANNVQSLYPNIKRLFMSGYTADVIAQQGVLDEGVHFIQKPFTLPDIAAMVRKVLDKG